jgi:hypothetical protein
MHLSLGGIRSSAFNTAHLVHKTAKSNHRPTQLRGGVVSRGVYQIYLKHERLKGPQMQEFQQQVQVDFISVAIIDVRYIS